MSSSIPNMLTLKFAFLFVALPYLVGVLMSTRNLEQLEQLFSPYLHQIFPSSPDRLLEEKEDFATVATLLDVDKCYGKLVASGIAENFDGLSVVMHRNGQHASCGETTANLALELKSVLVEMRRDGLSCPTLFEKYQVEAMLTRLFHKLTPSCTSEEKGRPKKPAFYTFCDMGTDKTPILLDHDDLVSVSANGETFLPCHFHNAHGVRVTAIKALSSMAAAAVRPEPQCNAQDDDTTCSTTPGATTGLRELHLYAVPAGRVFMHVAAHVGQIIDLPHVRGGDPNKPVYLEVLSVSPAVFDLHNFFSTDESQDVVDRALKEKRDSHRVKRSSTGATGHTVNERRTSESGFDTDGETSMTVKRRCFDVLGFDSYVESHADGLQILRYNLTKAYIPHMDWIDGNDNLEHDYESAQKGGNRFATILLYMTDLGEDDGGETVFTEAWPTGQAEKDRVQIDTALKDLRASDRGNILEVNSWQETMVAKCRTRLAIRPHAGRAVLFYSQYPNGEPDPNSRHGGCPVLAGTKYAANLWVWSTPRDGYPGNPKNPKLKRKVGGDLVPKGRVTAIFRNEGGDRAFDNAELFFDSGQEQRFWGKLGRGDAPITVHTYKSHIWVLKVDGKEIKSWHISSDNPEKQEFIV